MRSEKSQKNSNSLIPLVCNSEPLVSYSKHAKQPFVCPFIPSDNFNEYGFTLVELLVTLAVVALLVTFAVPNFRSAILNGRITTNTNDFISDFNLARSEALKRGTSVGICRVANLQAAMQCDGADWAGDRMIFADTNNDGAFNNGAEEVLRVRERLGSNTLTTINAPHPIIINSRGLLNNAAAPINFSLCDERGTSHGRAIVISVTGQISSAQNPGGC